MVEGTSDNMVSESRERIHKKSLRTLFTVLCGLLAGLILCSHTAYADENIPSDLGIEGSVSDPSIPISAEDDLIIREASKVIADSVYSTSDVRATDYAQLIYNYLVNTIHQDLSTMNGYNSSMNTRLLNIQNSLNGGSTNNTYIYNLVKDLKNFTVGSDTSGQSVSIWKMLLAIVDAWGIQDPGLNNGFLASQLANISGSSGAAVTGLNSVNTSLTSINTMLSNISNINYVDRSSYISLSGVSNTLEGPYTLPSSSQYFDGSLFYEIALSANFSNSNIAYIQLPTSNPRLGNYGFKIYNQFKNEIPFEYYSFGNTLYFLGFPSSISQPKFYLEQYLIGQGDDYSNELYYNANSQLKLFYGSDNISNSIYDSFLALISINHKLSSLEIIKNEIASPDLVHAKEESSATTKQALDDFTGDGSSAVTPSDVSSASDISDTVSEGVDAGGAVSDALTVFSPASDIYMWFSQDNKNYFIPLDINYPAYYNPSTDSSLPVYIDYATHELIINGVHYPLYPNPVRSLGHGNKSNDDIKWTDEVPDVLTYYNQQVQSQIGDDK